MSSSLISDLFSGLCLSVGLGAGLLGLQFPSWAQSPGSPLEYIPTPVMRTPELPPLKPILPEPTAAIHLVLKRSERRVYVYQGGAQIASYPVAVGREGWETPLGTWRVSDMQEHPIWIHPFTGEAIPAGPENPLGERWIGFWTNGRSYIGFHGTPTRDSIGQAASHGCVRMYNEDVRELYKTVKLGTRVTVEP